MNNIEVVLIPHYIERWLKSNNITLVELERLCDNFKNDLGEWSEDKTYKERMQDTKLYKLISENLSIKDTLALATSINMLLSKLFKNTGYETWDGDNDGHPLVSVCRHIISERNIYHNNNDAVNKLINDLSSDESILMSVNNIKEKYSINIVDKTIFVVIHEGFTDFIRLNNQEIGRVIRKDIVNTIYNISSRNSGSEFVTGNKYLKSFIRHD